MDKILLLATIESFSVRMSNIVMDYLRKNSKHFNVFDLLNYF